MRWCCSLLILLLAVPAYGAGPCDRADRLVADAGIVENIRGDADALKDRYREALALCPGHAVAHHKLADLYLAEGDDVRALRHYREAVRENPEDALAWYQQGEIHRLDRRDGEALLAYLKAAPGQERAREAVRDLLRGARELTVEEGEILDRQSLGILLAERRRVAEEGPLTRGVPGSGSGEEGRRAVPKLKLTFRNILFEVGSDDVKPGSVGQIAEIAGSLRDLEAYRLRIIGHTDRQPFRGCSRQESDRRNERLSLDRAESVAGFLAGFGIDPGRMETDGRGPWEPEDPRDTPEAYRKNRRVVIEVD